MKLLIRALLIPIGTAIAIVWTLCYLSSLLPSDHWMTFPITFTGACGVGFCAVWSVYVASNERP